MRMQKPAALSALLLAAFTANAQDVTLGPRVYRAKETTARRAALPSRIHSMRAPVAYRMEPLAPADIAPIGKTIAPRTGVHRALSPAALRTGGWETLDGGGKLWRWATESPEAAGLRVHFTAFNVGEGTVWVHDGSGADAEIHGPYTDRGLYGDGDFWSDVVLSSRVVVEYQPAPGTAVVNASEPPFRIAAVSHLFGDSPLFQGPLAAMASPAVKAAAAPCHLDVTCFPEWANTARSVAHIVFEEDGNSFVCSGTVMNSRPENNIPYFLTADHCVSTETVARTVQAFFLYQTTECNGPPASRRDAQRTLGAHYLTGTGVARGDFSLIQLNSVPDGTIFSGWSTTVLNIGDEAFGVHHPKGDYKRFSHGHRSITGGQLAGANPDFYYTVRYDGGLIEGGSSGSGLFREPGVLVGALSSGPKTETSEEACAIRPFPANYGRFSDMFPLFRQYLDPNNAEGGATPPPSPGGEALVSGEARTFSIGPVSGPTLLTGSGVYRIDVPQGAGSLAINIATGGAGAEVEFWVRRGQAPEIVDGRVVADFRSPGRSGNEVLTITPQSTPALQAGVYFVTLALFTPNSTVTGSITASVTAPPQGGGTSLVPGQPRRFTFQPVTGGTLFRGESGFTIQVPEGARVLEVELATDNPDHDADLYLRFQEDIGLTNGNVVADHRSDGPNGRESITINQSSQPPLRAGTYFVGIGLFSRGVVISGTITARITGGNTGATPPPTGAVVDLESGVSRNISIAPVTSAVLLGTSYRVVVPEGATRLEVRLSSPTPNVDVDLYGRAGQPPAVASGRVTADYRSTGNTADETIVIGASSDPPLRAGEYYFRLAVFTANTSIDTSLVATVTTGDAPPPPSQTDEPRALRSGVPAAWTLPVVDGGTLFIGGYGYYVDVPENATRLEVRLNTDTPNADTDLFVRFGAMPVVADGNVVTDFAGDGLTGNEVITITPDSRPALEPGRYFIALAQFTSGVQTTGSVVATVLTNDGGGATPGSPRRLTPNAPLKFELPAVERPTLYTGDWGYTIDVPSGVTRMEVRVRSAVPSVDVDVYVRRGAAVERSEEGRVISDWASEGETGNENLNIVASPGETLAADIYHLALALFTTGTPASGTVSINLVTVTGQRETIEYTIGENGSWLRKDVMPGQAVTAGGKHAAAIDVSAAEPMAEKVREPKPGVAIRVD
ncbi:MAG: PPC domain-containing protein [Bryobacteraceae bacterium]